MIGVRIQLKKPMFQPKSFLTRRLDTVTEEDFAKVYLESNISEVFSEPDPTLALDKLEKKILHCLDMIAPEKRIVTKAKHAAWMTREIKEEMDTRDRLLEVARQTGEDDDWANFRKQRNHAKHMMMKRAREYKSERLNVSDSKLMWKRVNTEANIKKGMKETKMKLVTERGVLEGDKEVADYMNLYFKTKVVKLEAQTSPSVEKCQEYARNYLKRTRGDEPIPWFGFSTVGTNHVRRIIAGLNTTGALGRDEISTKVLKMFAYVLAPAIRHVVNRSILTSTYPDHWKHGRICPQSSYVEGFGNYHEPAVTTTSRGNWSHAKLSTCLQERKKLSISMARD